MSVRFWKSSFSLAAVALLFAFSAQAAGECVFTSGVCSPTVSGYTCAVNPTQSGTCIATQIPASGTGSCQADTDCNVSERCTARVCVAAACAAACPTGQSCVHGQCTATPSAAPTPENPYPYNQALIGRPLAQPNLEINIPTVVFTPALVQDGKLTVNWIGQYISGVYKYLLGIGGFVAIVMIMIGGLEYTLSAGGGDVKKAKKRIQDAVTGLILLFSVYLILFTVAGPRLTTFNALSLDAISRIDPPAESEPAFVSGSVATNTTDATGSGIGGPGAQKVPAELLPDLQAAAKETMKKDVELMIASSFRTIEKQEELIRRNCKNPPGSQTCNPRDGRPETCILRGGKAESCPHTTGRALDIWGAKRVNGVLQQCISQDECQKNKTACRANECQAAVLSAMRAQGFCNLSSEPWHFEKPKMSSNCN